MSYKISGSVKITGSSTGNNCHDNMVKFVYQLMQAGVQSINLKKGYDGNYVWSGNLDFVLSDAQEVMQYIGGAIMQQEDEKRKRQAMRDERKRRLLNDDLARKKMEDNQ